MSKIVDESILVFFRVSLSKFSLENSLNFVGIRIFIVEYVRNVKRHFSTKQGILATQSHEWDESLDNRQARLYFLSCSALAIMTLELLACFTHVAFW